MPNWLSKAVETKYPINTGRGTASLSASEIGAAIRSKLKKSKAVLALFEQFEVSPDRLAELNIEICDLEDKYAETDLATMKLNSFLFEDGNFFEDYFFIVCHEIVHFLSRHVEEKSYFNDPEEVTGFVSSIAYEIEQGTDMDVIWNRIYPKVEFHFHNESDAREFFRRMTEKAQKMLLR